MTNPAIPSSPPSMSATIPTGPLPYGLAILALRPVLLFVGALALRGLNIWAGYMNVVMVVVDVVTLAVLAWLMQRQGGRLSDLVGQNRGVRDLGWALLTFVIVTVGFFACSFAANLITYGGAPPAAALDAAKPPVWLGIWSVAILPVTVAIAEELAYRGYGQHSLAKHWHKVAAVVVMAVFFGLQHIPLSMDTPQSMLARFLTTFFAGLVFGGLVLWQKRLGPVIFAHWLLDVLFLGLPMLLWSLS